MAPLCLAALPQGVDIDHGTQVVEPQLRGRLSRLPHRTLGRLPITQQHIRAVAGPDATGIERNANRRTDPLTERPGGHIDER